MITVKSYYRNGKLVKSYTRGGNPKKKKTSKLQDRVKKQDEAVKKAKSKVKPKTAVTKEEKFIPIPGIYGVYVKETRENAKKLKVNITDDEVKSVYYYTGENHSDRINKSLRAGHKLHGDDADIANGLDSLLNKLPNYKGDVHRLSSVNDSDLQKIFSTYKYGSIVSDRAFLSTSKFKALPSIKTFDKNVFIVSITSRTGKDISKLSQYPDEHEVLFKRDTKFEVFDDIRFIDGKYHLSLVES